MHLFLADREDDGQNMEQEESGEDFSDVELSGDEDSRDLANRIRDRTGMYLVWFANLVGI